MKTRFYHYFKQHKMALFCVVIFLFIFILSLSANFIANDRPLLIYYQQNFYFPIFKDYPETTFGGVLETAAVYSDPAVQNLIHQHGWFIQPIIPFSYQTVNLSLSVPVPSPPSLQNWLGTDDQGRDVVARILYGLRISLLFGVILTILSMLLGIFIGAIQGYYAGWVDLLGQRIIEIWSGLPQLLIIIILSSLVVANIYWLFLLMLCFGWLSIVSLVRAEFLKMRNLDYIRAAIIIGENKFNIIFKQILPNVLGVILSQFPFILAANITILTSLDFIGYGLPTDMPSLGELLQQGKNNLHAPWLILSGFFTFTIILTLLIYISEVLRDVFDPKR